MYDVKRILPWLRNDFEKNKNIYFNRLDFLTYLRSIVKVKSKFYTNYSCVNQK